MEKKHLKSLIHGMYSFNYDDKTFKCKFNIAYATIRVQDFIDNICVFYYYCHGLCTCFHRDYAKLIFTQLNEIQNSNNHEQMSNWLI